mmetsp:Transcript_1754/g.6401  ORF Transcript_1754/g.6401 Transcript_1754/m.6401 type:complete len:592 (+) Transcript_1754:1-1776(+)
MNLITAYPKCWLECARLWGPDMDDAPGCKSRPDEGLDAINTLALGVLGMFSHAMFELIDFLGVRFGYDPTSLHAMPYDFRLLPHKLELRDGYFSHFKAKMEVEVRRTGQRSIVIAHSLGCKVFAYFLEWLKADVGANSRDVWIDRHVAIYVANGNPILGSPDIATALVVGLQQGMPISLKYIHEVLASSGGLLNLMPASASPGRPKRFHGASLPEHARAELPWIRYTSDDGTSGTYGPEACCGPNSSHAFFQQAGLLNDTLLGNLALMLEEASLRDPFVGDVFKPEMVESRPPIDVVIAAYGIGSKTVLQTSFTLGAEQHLTPPFNVDKLEVDQPGVEWRLPSRIWHYNNSNAEIGAKHRRLIDGKGRTISQSSDEFARSGDDTVPFASLSAAHDWLGESVRVHSLPMKATFLADEAVTGEYDAANRAPSFPDAKPPETPRLTIFESHGAAADGQATHTEVWEMEGVSHRFSANDEVFLTHLERKLHEHMAATKSKREAGYLTENRHHDENLDIYLRCHEPKSDLDCFWIYGAAKCEYPEHCEYRYVLGDLTLSQSCRLQRKVCRADGGDNCEAEDRGMRPPGVTERRKAR